MLVGTSYDPLEIRSHIIIHPNCFCSGRLSHLIFVIVVDVCDDIIVCFVLVVVFYS